MIIYPSHNNTTLSISLVFASMIFMLTSCESISSKTHVSKDNYNSSVPNFCIAKDGGLLVTEVREYEGGARLVMWAKRGDRARSGCSRRFDV